MKWLWFKFKRFWVQIGQAFVLLFQRNLGSLKRSVIPIRADGVVPNKLTVVSVNTIRDTFKMDELKIPSIVAKFFVINDIRIMGQSQIIGANPDNGIPAEVFSSEAFGMQIDFDVAQIAVPIEFWITNISDSPKDFMGAAIGKVIA